VLVGFIVNPYAGLGGAIGFKGTNEEAIERALSLGYDLIAPRRAVEFLVNLRGGNLRFITGAGLMGEYELAEAGLSNLIERVVGERKSRTSREDTLKAAGEMVDHGADVLVFVGGDGTLKDIYEATKGSTPVIGVPSGVKVYSGAFAYTPREAARILESYASGRGSLVEAEVLDVDEDLFRRDVLDLRVYGVVKTIRVEGLLQPSKGLSNTIDEDENKLAIARYLFENMQGDAYYILGPGTTVKALRHFVKGELSLLGVDVIYGGTVLLKDTWEKPILDVLSGNAKAYIVVSPIGRQGFIFGRGNQQISPRVLRLVKKDNIIVVATRRKIRELEYLRVYTGDEEIDTRLRGYYKVLVDYGIYEVKKAI